MDEFKIDRFLGIIILILLLVFLVFFLTYGTNPCYKCKFEIDDQELDIKEFFGLFSSKCLTHESNPVFGNLEFNISILNFSD